MEWEQKRAEGAQEPERDPDKQSEPFSPDGEYDSLEAWSDEEER